MTYGEYEDSDVKPKKSYSKDADRSWTGPCEFCRAQLKGCSVDKDGCIKCPECDQKIAVSKKL